MNVVEFIKDLLICALNKGKEKSLVRGFFIHSSIFETFKNLPGMSTRIQNVWDYELQIGETSFSVKLVFFRCDGSGSFTFMVDLCKLADFSFWWEKNLALYVPVQHFAVLQKFIQIENLHQFTDSIKDEKGVIDTNEMVRVVRFAIEGESRKRYFTLKFMEFYYKQNPPHNTMNFYFRVAFPWLQPWVLTKFDIPFEIDNPFYSIISITLQHTNHLSNNIFDLVAVRMALCDCRNLESTAFVQSEIDREIVRTLYDPKYSISSVFNLELYMQIKNIKTNERILYLMTYFFYTFQDFLVNRVKNVNNDGRTIKLCNNKEVLNELTLKSNIKFRIDGRKFDGMSFKLFNDLAGCVNVTEIVLDTNYRLNNNMDGIDRLKFLNKQTHVYLNGENTDGFIGEFVLCLQKHHVNENVLLWLNINCELKSYSIFDNIPIFRVAFSNITITTPMLIDFNSCLNIRAKIAFRKCKLEYEPENWMLLIYLNHLDTVEIQEEMCTWESMFDAVAEMFRISKMTELVFTRDIIIISDQTVALRNFKCVLVEDGTKLELQHRTSDDIFDIYSLKSGLESDDGTDYDFYQ